MSLRYVAEDLADMAASQRADGVRLLGEWLHAEGGVELMKDVFDLALASRGYASLPSVNAIWKEVGGWGVSL